MPVPHIVVVGSINLDLVARLPRLPRPGETVSGDDFRTIPGGKGANQAVAAARLGARVTMIGRVGDDPFGELLKQSLDQCGVWTEHVLVTPGYSSGVAMIGVETSGANSIAVIAGANGCLTPDDIVRRADIIASADALLVQLETPIDTVTAAVQIARQVAVCSILDPAPAPTGTLPEILREADLISPNQTEAEVLTGISVDNLESAEEAARVLQRGGAREVVLKLGELGVLVCAADGRLEHVGAASVNVVDTTAAGDAFTAGLAVALAEGRSLSDAARFGCAAGSLACTVHGAQTAMPTRAAVDELLRRNGFNLE